MRIRGVTRRATSTRLSGGARARVRATELVHEPIDNAVEGEAGVEASVRKVDEVAGVVEWG